VLSTDREEFVKRLRVLFAGLDKPLGEAKETAFWIALAQMSLIEFGRCCDFVLEELQDGDKRREYTTRFTPGDVWTARRRLRAKVSAAVQEQTGAPPAQWAGDAWDIRANLALRGYFDDQTRRGIHYCDSETLEGIRPAHTPSDETRALIAPLLAYKRAWAQDMRELHAEQGFVSADVQRRTFLECMRRADVEVDLVRQEYDHRGHRSAA